MNFEKAYKEMLKGKKIRRKSWEKMHHMRYVEATKEHDATIRTYKTEFNNFFADASILISNGWFVVGDDSKELSFLEALEELKNKKEVSNKLWKDKFIFLDGDQFAYCSTIEANFMPTYRDLIANDWEVMS